MALDAVDFAPGRDVPGPADQAGHPQAAFPGGPLLAAERRVPAVRVKDELVAVVGAVDDDGVFGDPQVLDLLENRADLLVVLEHPGPHHVLLGASLVHRHLEKLRVGMRPDVDRGRVEPDEEGLVALSDAVEVLQRLVGHFLVEGHHALAGERTRVLDFLHPDLAEFRIDGRVVHRRSSSGSSSAFR